MLVAAAVALPKPQQRCHRCSRRGSLVCKEPAITESELVGLFTQLFEKIALPENDALKMLARLEKWEREGNSFIDTSLQELGEEYAEAHNEERNLLRQHNKGRVDEQLYIEERAEILNRKKEISDQKTALLEQGPSIWIEPLRKVINTVGEPNLPTAADDLRKIRSAAETIGLNFTLHPQNPQKLACDLKFGFPPLAERESSQQWWAILDSNQ